MDCKELYKFIKKGEDSRAQFKARINSPDALAAEICSFANTEGGVILIGVGDKGDIIGVQNINRLNQQISSAASHKIEPLISVITENT